MIRGVGLFLIGGFLACNAIYFLYFFAIDDPNVNYQLNTATQKQEAESKNNLNYQNYRDFVREIDVYNASAIFNSVNSALKQKDSDIFPAGVSYFPAVIPEGTILYHAGAGIPDGFEWLAMDMEFSMNFGSRGRKTRGSKSLNRFGNWGPGGPKHGPNFKKRDNEDESTDSTEDTENNHNYCDDNDGNNNGFHGPNNRISSFMSFRVKRDLNKMLYLDGASASKSKDTGEMDTQKILSDEIVKRLNLTDESDEDGEDGNEKKTFVMDERLYAQNICKWGEQFGLHGYIRVEMGFEVVLCDFSNLEMISNVSMKFSDNILNLPPNQDITFKNGWPINCNDGTLMDDLLTPEQKTILELENFREDKLVRLDVIEGWEQARIAGISHNWGDKRIGIDYRYLITGINRTWLDPNAYKRRLAYAGNETLVEIVDDLEHILKNFQFNQYRSNNWQLKTEQVVDKFAPIILSLEHLLNSSALNFQDKVLNITMYTLPFVKRYWHKVEDDYHSNGINFGVWEYSYPLLSLQTDSDYLIWSSFVNILDSIFDTIYNVFDNVSPLATECLTNGYIDETKEEAVLKPLLEQIHQLKSILNWVQFGYKCARACEWDEICYTPSWGPGPLGWALPSDYNSTGMIGFINDDENKLLVIDSNEQCIKVTDLLQGRG
ncbi:uncharacterized protein SCODWIG_00713 [Saccharomycodes ludwigii]|uniref:Uncharacterized protein n=1 Tax=Saccharomycodes ludwigii TaxID=36035 RepID=A0A376B2W0_9ASCO|nr:uncharacterized protein SCODWIG_00713 [Saccharomycodes ludwigii]